jgi:hypothetical protein
MGTNYYTKTKKCPECGHQPEGIHLGKSSGGWQFSFQYNGGQYYKNVEEMKEWLKDKAILDEYGNSISNKEFWVMVERKQKEEKLNHAKFCHEKYPYTRETEHVIDGYSFSDCEFS